MMNRALPLLLSVALFSGSVVAAPKDDEARAKVLFDEARDLVKAGKWPEACEKLAESKKLSPRMLTTYRLADCHEHIGKTATAHAGFIEAADLAKAVSDSAKQQDALTRAKQVEGKLSRIVLELPPESVTIKIDGNTIPPALTREKLPLDPGEHELVASAEGKKPRSVTFTVPPGPATTNVSVAALEDVTVAAPKETPPVAVEPPPPPIDDTKPTTSSSALKTAGFVTMGVGIVALGVGSYLGLSAKGLDRDAEKLCTPGCTPEGKSLNDDARSRGNLATVVFTIGAVAAVSGLVLVLVAPSSSSHRSGSGASATLTPWVAHTGGGLGLSGSF